LTRLVCTANADDVSFTADFLHADKAAEDRSAFIRWRHQVLEMMAGANIYDDYYFPNPPIMPISLYPLMTLPPLQGALTWYALKVGLTVLSVWFCFKMVRFDDRVLPSWVQGLILLLSFRPILGDLQAASMLAPRIDEPVFSCSVGVAKHDPRIYRIAAERLGVETGDCLFVDDQPLFVEGALAAGMDAVRLGGDIQRLEDVLELVE